jgi:HAD superfamily hydrolase (TIGR01509 family)
MVRSAGKSPGTRPQGALIFDLDGTLVDNVYEHVLAWREAFEEAGIQLAVWRIHRQIGMSGGLFVSALMRETGKKISPEKATRIQRSHAAAYKRLAKEIHPLPGTPALLRYLSRIKVQYAIATSGHMKTVRHTLKVLNVGPRVPIITRDLVAHAKPDPDLFLAAAERLGRPISECVAVGDSVWDQLAARRARALGVGLLSGGYGEDD